MATCSSCGATFTCGMKETSEPCWCAALPPLQTVVPLQDCLCVGCLAARLAAQSGGATTIAAGHDG
ncbi:MAG: hypothetical protein KAX84_17165 [Burkholderiales bacterium]|nr:hypothetical protein [Betaproteobacteria bacterium]MBP8297845.1 hypothetical protein [Burkholderiales bacterium]